MIVQIPIEQTNNPYAAGTPVNTGFENHIDFLREVKNTYGRFARETSELDGKIVNLPRGVMVYRIAVDKELVGNVAAIVE